MAHLVLPHPGADGRGVYTAALTASDQPLALGVRVGDTRAALAGALQLASQKHRIRALEAAQHPGLDAMATSLNKAAETFADVDTQLANALKG
jgi:hypothetical protein